MKIRRLAIVPPSLPSAALTVRTAALLAALTSAMAPAAAAPAVPSAGQLVGDAVAGKSEFVRCGWCHQVGPSARNAFGPPLQNIVGRKAGAAPGFTYSDAMKKTGFVWSEAQLTAFLHEPKQVVPDNKMRFWGISDPQRVANLVAYLRTLQDRR